MNTSENKTKLSLDELRKRIAKLTGQVQRSSDERYLAAKLDRLEEKKRKGEDVRSRWGNEPHEPVTISLTRPARDALRKLADDDAEGNVSQLVMRALAEYATRTHASPHIRRALGVEVKS